MHTKEPWTIEVSEEYDSSFDIRKGEWYVATTHDGCEGNNNSESNARRIVACVNACAGIPTELIEQGGFAAVPVATHREVKQQRDDLLAALKEIASMENRYDSGDWDEIEDARNIAKAAIAKAEGL